MSGNRMVTLATFSNPIEAELAKNRLLDEGITAHLLGDIGGNPFAGVGGLFGRMSLMVSEADAQRAGRVLAEEEPDEPLEPENEESTAIKAPEWASTDIAAEDDPEARYRAADVDFQPGKRLTKEERIEAGQWMAMGNETVGPEAEEEDIKVAWTPDAVATRAWRSAVVGLLLLSAFPLWGYFILPSLAVILYSVVLLISLLSMSEEMSAAGRKRLYGALVVDGMLMLGAVLFFLSIVPRILRL